MTTVDTTNSLVTCKLDTLRNASVILDSMMPPRSTITSHDIDFVEMDDSKNHGVLDFSTCTMDYLTPQVEKLIALYMRCIAPIQVQYKDADDSLAKEHKDAFNQTLLSHNVIVQIDQLELDIRAVYNQFAKQILKDKHLQSKYKSQIMSVFEYLEQLEKGTKLSSKKLRKRRKDSQITECSECKSKMTLYVNSGEYKCGTCSFKKTAYGIVPADVYLDHTATSKSTGNYRQEDNCEIWLNKIQGLESKEIRKSVLKKLRRKAIEEDAIHAQDATCRRIRMWLKDKDVDETSYNNHTPKIRFELTGEAPEKLTEEETQKMKLYFKPVMNAYNRIKPPERKNSLYQPYLILKILEQVVDRSTEERERRFLRIVSNIHFQDRNTIRRNDETMMKIDVGLKFVPTDVEYYMTNTC